MPKPYASAQKIALAAVLNVEPPVYELPSPSKPLANSLPSKCGDSLVAADECKCHGGHGRPWIFDTALHSRRFASLLQSSLESGAGFEKEFLAIARHAGAR